MTDIELALRLMIYSFIVSVIIIQINQFRNEKKS